MKKITFILLALLSGTAFAQNESAIDPGTTYTADANATVNAEIVSPISIENNRGLNFGRLIGNEAGGTVEIKATSEGEREANQDLLALTGDAHSSAEFTFNAAKDYKYSVTLSGLTQLATKDGETMPLTLGHSLAATNNVGKGTDEKLYVGGELELGSFQAEGEYSGEVTVTVTYE